MQFTNTALFTFLSLAALGAARPGGDTQQSIVEQREAEPKGGRHRPGGHHAGVGPFTSPPFPSKVVCSITDKESTVISGYKRRVLSV
jgi:hypothetical protein